MVGLGGRVGWSHWVVGLGGGWLDYLEIRLTSVQLSWDLTELGKITSEKMQ